MDDVQNSDGYVLFGHETLRKTTKIYGQDTLWFAGISNPVPQEYKLRGLPQQKPAE
jgi:hypothetical protein